MTNTSFLGKLLLASGDAVYDWDLEADHIEWIGAWKQLFGDSHPPKNSRDFYDFIFEDDRNYVCGIESQTIDREYRVRLSDGRVVTVREYGIAESSGGKLVRQYGLLRLIEPGILQSLENNWQGRDELTGCLNCSSLLLQIQRSLVSAKLTKTPCTYLVLGINKMSTVNEAVGMETGDGLLRGVARRIADILPARAYLGRVGGDMFGILLVGSLAREFPALAERLLQDFRSQPVVTSEVPLHITVSIGALRLPGVAHSAIEAMIFAEQALHDANQRGRNLFIEYIESSERMQENRRLLELGGRVKRALMQDELHLAYQPVVDSQSGQPVFYEALARIFDDNGTIIPAARFIPVVEQQGLALELDRHVLNLVVRELEAHPNLCIAMNISALTAAKADWPEYVRGVLGKRRSVAERLIVEITETAAIVDVEETRRFVDILRSMGGRVALDDFGAGFTSIRHLRSLALSIMKIDRELLFDVLNNAEQQHIVRMSLEIARGLGLKTVAEGVETAGVAEWLKGEKVDMMQGYYFGKPVLDKPWLTRDTSEPKIALQDPAYL